MLYLALSCLQGFKANIAISELLALKPDGLQLTPGCVPPFELEIPIQTRTHHGFSKTFYKKNVWHEGKITGTWDSVHPPLKKHVHDNWRPPFGIIIETMYPGYADMSTGDEIERAIDEQRLIAVDVAHLDMQIRQDLLSNAQRQRILNYENVKEIHVSTSVGIKDSHNAVDPNHWGTRWAIERISEIPVVIESYMQKMSYEERVSQVEIFR